MKDDEERRRDQALARYQVISGYLALDPPRGTRQALRDKLAAKTWTDADGEPMQVAAETIRSWVRRYRRKGLEGLMDKRRPRPGVRILSPTVIELVCDLKREVPERSLDRLIRILEDTGQIENGLVSRSTLHRVLQAEGLSGRPVPVSDDEDLDRFEADAPNQLWQSDMLKGPWLPDPRRPGKMRRAHLYAFLDDHSRLVLHGRFSFKGDLPALELVFRRSLQKWGKPGRCYYDNGAVYRSRHMKHIVAELGIHGIAFTKPYRPMGHGKIEAFNRYCTAAFVAEVKSSSIQTLDELNEAFVAWVELEYNRKNHSETGQTPRDRWMAGVEKVTYLDEESLRQAFLFQETRKADKAGLFSLFGTRYQAGAGLGGKRIRVRFDPEQLDEIEIWHDGRFVERVRPFEVRPHRRPRAAAPAPSAPSEGSTHQEDRPSPTVDWLSHLVEKRRSKGFLEPTPHQLAQQAQAERQQDDDAFVALLHEHLEPAVVDPGVIREFLARFGPFDPKAAEEALRRVLRQQPADQHVQITLEAMRELLVGGNP